MSAFGLEQVEQQLAEIRRELGRVLGPQKVVLSFKEAASRLDVSERTLRRLVRSGQLLTVPIGQTPKVPLSEVLRYATPRRTSAMPEKTKRPATTLQRGSKSRRDAEAAKAAALVAERRRRRQR